MNCDLVKLNFKIIFKKGKAGIENEIYYSSAAGKISCNECYKVFKKGDVYYFWYGNGEGYKPTPALDVDEYLLCVRCVKKRR